MIPQTPPKEQTKKLSPSTWSPARNEVTKAPEVMKRPVKERLGRNKDYVWDETPRRPSNNGPRRSKRIFEHNPFKEVPNSTPDYGTETNTVSGTQPMITTAKQKKKTNK